MLVLGIDPGIAITGYGLVTEDTESDIDVVAYGVVATPPHTPVEQRLQQIYHGVRAIIEHHHPTTAAVEKLLFGKNVTTAMNVGQARGVTLLAMADCGLSIAEYTPASIKQAVAGYGNATKSQVQEMVRLLLRLDDIPRPDDAADALAVSITHLLNVRYQRLTAEE
jgi:crossover junction endodeoxyribonuclease RuvC